MRESKKTSAQSELSRPIPRNSVESDQGCTSKIYFDNAGNKMSLKLYNVTLTSGKQQALLQQSKRLYNVNEVGFFSTKYRYSADFDRAELTCYRTNFPYTSSGYRNGAFWYIVLRVMLLIYPRHDSILEL